MKTNQDPRCCCPTKSLTDHVIAIYEANDTLSAGLAELIARRDTNRKATDKACKLLAAGKPFYYSVDDGETWVLAKDDPRMWKYLHRYTYQVCDDSEYKKLKGPQYIAHTPETMPCNRVAVHRQMEGSIVKRLVRCAVEVDTLHHGGHFFFGGGWVTGEWLKNNATWEADGKPVAQDMEGGE